MNILLAEDEKQLSRALVTAMQATGYHVDPAYNGQEAVDLAGQRAYDVIILDIMMPKLNGIEALKQLRQTGNKTYVIMLTAMAEIDDKVTGLDAGADDYLTKPFSSVVLRSVVKRLMTSKKELKEYYYSPESAYEQSGGQLIHQEDKEFMDEVISIIRENLEEETLRPELIAEKLGMNTRSLYRRFKKISPLTPSDFIKDYRMTYAAQLLVTTNLNVQEIIYKVGISNKSYFYREFAARYNQTPMEYRNKQ